MYLRIMNQLDLECIREMLERSIPDEETRKNITSRLEQIIHTLDEFYFSDRNSFSYGGFVFLITEKHEAEKVREKIIQCYHLKNKMEYDESICQNEGNVWKEELFLRSSEDSIVIIYPKENNKEEK